MKRFIGFIVLQTVGVWTIDGILYLVKDNLASVIHAYAVSLVYYILLWIQVKG